MALALPFVNGGSLAVQQPTAFNLSALGDLTSLIVNQAEKRRAEQLVLAKEARDSAQAMGLEAMRVQQQREQDAAANDRALQAAKMSDQSALDRLNTEYDLRGKEAILEAALKPKTDFQYDDTSPGGSNPGSTPTTTGVATEFGYKDPQDNGLGAWGDVTNDPNVLGVSLPPDVLAQHFGSADAAHGKMVEVTNPATGKKGVYPIIDKGPAQWVINRQGPTIDLTHAANLELGGDGKTPMQWRILDHPADQGPLTALNLSPDGTAAPDLSVPTPRGAVISPPPAAVQPPAPATPSPNDPHWMRGYSGPYLKGVPIAGLPGAMAIQTPEGVKIVTSKTGIPDAATSDQPPAGQVAGLPIKSVTVDPKGLKHFTYGSPVSKSQAASPLDKALAAKTATNITDSEDKAAALQGALVTMDTLLNDKAFQTGPWAGRAGAVGQFVNEDYASKRQEFESAANAIAMSMRVAGSGSMSDKDLAFLVAQAPSMNKTNDANRNILKRLRLANQAILDRNQYVVRRASEGVPLAKAREEYAAYAQANPIFQRDESGMIAEAPRPTIDDWMKSGSPQSPSAVTAGTQPQGDGSAAPDGKTISAAQASQILGRQVFPGAQLHDRLGNVINVTQ